MSVSIDMTCFVCVVIVYTKIANGINQPKQGLKKVVVWCP